LLPSQHILKIILQVRNKGNILYKWIVSRNPEFLKSRRLIDLEDALGLFDSVDAIFNDRRTGGNIQHDMTALLRQSVYSRLAGYEDVNDAERLLIDPVMRTIAGKKNRSKNASSANTDRTLRN